MNIIRYQDNRGTAQLFVVATLDKNQRKLLSGLGMLDILQDTRQWNTYADIAKAAMLSKPNLDEYRDDYDFFTIDLLNYSDIYVSKNSLLRKLLVGWDDLIATMTSRSMRNYLKGDDAYYETHSLDTEEIIEIFMHKSVSLNQQLAKHYMASTRFLNVMIPKNSYDSFYYEAVNNNPDVKDEYIDSVVIQEQTYDLTDFQFIDKPVGEIHKVRKSKSGFFCQVVIEELPSESTDKFERVILDCDNYNDMQKLHGYADITEDDTFLYLRFLYNQNRKYEVFSKSKTVLVEHLTENTVRILSDDLLKHAKALGIVKYGRYINLQEYQRTLTLESIREKLFVNRMKLCSWISDDYVYEDTISGYRHVDKNNGQWVGNEYMFQSMQVSQEFFDTDNFRSRNLQYIFNNLHWFMLNVNADVVKTLGNYRQGYCTNSNVLIVEDGKITGYELKHSLAGINLPVIRNQECWFKNHKFTFRNSDFEGMRFAVIVANYDIPKDTLQTRLVIENDTLALILLVNYAEYGMIRSTIQHGNNSYFFTVTNDFCDSDCHSGNDGIEKTYDLIEHRDFYKNRVNVLLPFAMKSKLPKEILMDYFVKVIEGNGTREIVPDTPRNDIDLNPPYRIDE